MGIVECKDFNPKTTGPVGIDIVDNLESKRRELGMQLSFICSNAGFTRDAIRKARGEGIGLIGVMRKGDTRVRFAIVDEFYTRKVRLTSFSVNFNEPTPLVIPGVSANNILYKGVPIANWIFDRTRKIVAANPIVNGPFKAAYVFTSPLLFEWPGGKAEVTNFFFYVSLQGGWFAHQVEFDSPTAVYDWIRRHVRPGPGAGNLEIKGIDIYRGEPLSCPPGLWANDRELLPGEMDLGLVLVEHLGELDDPLPELDRFISPDQLVLRLAGMPRAYGVSNPSYLSSSFEQ